MNVLPLLLLATIPLDAVAVDRVDCIEVNHFHDDEGREVFVQMLYWRNDRCDDWRLFKCPTQRPRYDHDRQEWLSVWWDGDALRDVRAPCFRESWTQYDVEVADREKNCKEMRRGLARARRP